jgi:hypothetical protein
LCVELTKDQRNDLFRVIEASELDLAECDLVLRRSEDPRVIHSASKSYFEISKRPPVARGTDANYVIRMSVGDDKDHLGSGSSVPWGSLLTSLSIWTRDVVDWLEGGGREVGADDLWEGFRRGRRVPLTDRHNSSRSKPFAEAQHGSSVNTWAVEAAHGSAGNAPFTAAENTSELSNEQMSRVETSNLWARWVAAVTLSALAFVLCWACLLFGVHAGSAVALGWAILPFSVALTLSAVWADSVRRDADKGGMTAEVPRRGPSSRSMR